MKTMKLQFTFLAAMAVVAGSLLLGSCQHEPFGESKEVAYSAFAFGNAGSQQLVLNNLSGEIRNITSGASWLSGADAGQSADGYPMITISNTDGKGAKATLTVTDNSGNRALITVQHQAITDGDTASGGNDSFTSNWWNFDAIPMEGFSAPQKAPWAIEGGATIPDFVRLQYLPEDGWEMAFSYVNNPTMKGVRTFALYNRWTGFMRVYTYVEDPRDWGNELLFRTYFGGSSDSVLYPFYHCMQYGIPSNHELGRNLLRNAQIVKNQDQTFMDWVTPYQRSSSLQRGWYAFDYDMSGFVPAGKDWLSDRSSARFTFLADTKETSTISLRGALTGKIEGEFENPQDIQQGGGSILHSLTSWAGTLSNTMLSGFTTAANYSKVLADQESAAARDLEHISPLDIVEGAGPTMAIQMNAMKFAQVKYWGGFVAGLAGVGFDFLANWTDPISYEHQPGQVTLNMDTTVELDGYLTTTKANSFAPLAVSAQAIESANGPDGHLGSGLWGLAEDPVIYIDRDVLLSNVSTVNLVRKGNNVYADPAAPSHALRMVYFLDPTTVKLNVNTADIPGVKKVSVITTCGIYPEREKGNTKPYRDMLMLDSSAYDISAGKSVVKLNTYSSTPRLALIKPDDLVSEDPNAYENKDNCAFATQPLPNEADDPLAYRFYGRVISEGWQDILANPQVFLPFGQKDNSYLLGAIPRPDFVVSVAIVVEGEQANGQGITLNYSKCFIPRIEFVDHATAKNRVVDIASYAITCLKEEPVSTLANDSSVPVYHPDGAAMVYKTLDIYNKIK